jgi:branched-chain amino acid transport system permease protein
MTTPTDPPAATPPASQPPTAPPLGHPPSGTAWRGRVEGVRGAFGRQPWFVKWPIWILLLVGAYFLPDLGNIPIIGPQIVTAGTDWYTALFHISYYVLLALGLNVVVGYAGLLDLGYVGFFAVGTYTVALLTSGDSQFNLNWPWLAAVPVAVAIAMFSGLILGWPTLRLRGDYLAIVTLGFAEIIRIFADSTKLLRGDRGFSFVPHPPGHHANGKPIFGDIDARPYYWVGLTVILLVIIGVRNLDRSRVGRSWLAIREDEEAAEIMGVRTIKFKLWAFAIGAFIGGLGGTLFAGENGFINSSTFVIQFSILILAGVVMGGAGNIPGAILGGIVISYVPDRLTGIKLFGTDAFEYRFIIFGIIIVLIMIFRSQGLIPSRRRAMELKDRAREVAPQ